MNIYKNSFFLVERYNMDHSVKVILATVLKVSMINIVEMTKQSGNLFFRQHHLGSVKRQNCVQGTWVLIFEDKRGNNLPYQIQRPEIRKY